ncbi:MAG: hypothetical protein JNK82_43560 [Myxococcaceae bacterium]|nr:hypothetical protein [Myxococcaceae bacterium]
MNTALLWVDVVNQVPRDCVAAQSAEVTERALEQLESVALEADTRPSSSIRW